MDRIFHYTKIETLRLILETHSIRLNALKNLDDLLEGTCLDEFDFSSYYYASSWTKESQESIPLWSMYADGMKGIRIEADSDFLIADEDRKDCHIKNCVSDDVLAFPIYDDVLGNAFLVDVEYSDEQPRFLTGHPRGYISPEHSRIGKIKPTAWSFQREVRYVLQGISKKNIATFGDTLFDKYFNAAINLKPNETEYIDIKFELNKWENANFLLGPNTSPEELTFVESIVRQHIKNYSGNIRKSTLQIRTH